MNYVGLGAQYDTNAMLFGIRWSVGVDMTNTNRSLHDPVISNGVKLRTRSNDFFVQGLVR